MRSRSFAGGKRQFLKTDLLKFCEFVTGWNPDDELNEELDDVEEFDAQLNEDAARRGHRCPRWTRTRQCLATGRR